MREAWLELLRCPVTGEPYDLDATRATPGEVIEGFLVARGGREVRPLLSGLAVLPRDLRAHLRRFGLTYERVPLADSRVVRFVLGTTGRSGYDVVPFDEVVARYGDLVPPGTYDEPPEPASEDAALAALLSGLEGEFHRALDIGCGVGRGVFVLLDRVDMALGIDRSVARVRRARNVATTNADFFLPAPVDTGLVQVPLELSRLDRRGADFAVADADALPLSRGCMDLVVLRKGDGLGRHPARTLHEALRVLAPGAVLVLEGEGDTPWPGWEFLGRERMLGAWRFTG